MNIEYSRRIFEKSSNTKLIENPSSGSRQVDGRTNTKKLLVASRNFAKEP